MTGAAEAITAVLEQWLERDPAQATLTFMTETLMGLYGDPRVFGGGAWAGVLPTHLSSTDAVAHRRKHSLFPRRRVRRGGEPHVGAKAKVLAVAS